MVVMAYVLALQWLSEHPELIVAAWLESGFVVESDYEAEGLGDLAQRANDIRRGKNTEMENAFKHQKGLWARNDIMLASGIAEAAVTTAADGGLQGSSFELSWMCSNLPHADSCTPKKRTQDHLQFSPPAVEEKRVSKALEKAVRDQISRELEAKSAAAQAQHDISIDRAAADIVHAAAARLRLTGKQGACKPTCHAEWHADGCPKNPRNLAVASSALERKALAAGKVMQSVFGPTDGKKLLLSLGLPPTSWEKLQQTFDAARTLPGRDILGGPMKKIPKEIHVGILEKVSKGLLPMTTLQQRINHMASDFSLRVPSELEAAKCWGYIHPHTHAPPGMIWRQLPKPNAWKLEPSKGG